MILVSIIVPVYNVEKYLARCLDSLLAQTYGDLEIILVNDGSTDRSAEIATPYVRKNSHVRWIDLESNRGQMRARQTGYMAAKGDYITFCDSDDTLPADAIRSLLTVALEGNYDIVSGEAQFIPVQGEPGLFCGGQSFNCAHDPIDIYRALLEGRLSHNLWSKLFKRELLQDYPYRTYDHCTNGEDGLLFYQVAEHCRSLKHIDTVVYNYYQNLQSSSNVRLSEKAIRSILLLSAYRKGLVSKYPRLEKLVSHHITSVLVNMYYSGYQRDMDLDGLLEEYGLSEYATVPYIFKHYPFAEACKFWLKKYIFNARD